jgi:UDP-N-acetylmuramate dehydrogenase
MLIFKNIPLNNYNTFRLGYKADCLVRVKTEREAVAFMRKNFSWKDPLLIIGDGSNILFTNDFRGTILKPELKGIRIEKSSGSEVIVSAGAGVKWDNLVKWTVEKGLCGFENLSLIPGQTGAAAVQNIGAYGTEIKETILKVRSISTQDGSVRIFDRDECNFGYRSSVFKTTEKGKFLVTRVWFRLSNDKRFKIDYGSVREEINKLGEINLANIRQAVINIRRNKLPDPDITGNAGSFFKNPVVSAERAADLKKLFPGMPCYEQNSSDVKLAAGWLIEQCGWKGRSIGNAGVHEKQALVLINHGSASGEEIFTLSEMIKNSVKNKFDIELEREVEVIGKSFSC